MGMIADRLRVQLDEMKARHDAHQREAELELQQMQAELKRLTELNDRLLADLGECDE